MNAPLSTAPKIACEGLWKFFGDGPRAVTALQDVNLQIRANEFVTFVGASGCGKSTLLRTIAGLEPYSRGTPDGGRPARQRPGAGPRDGLPALQPLPLAERDREHPLLPPACHPHTRERSTADVEAASGRADALLRLMGLTASAKAYPNQLSGGMQQRVAIARALMGQPQMLLMDEPFGALDAQTREVMHDLILHVHRLERSTIVFVTHDVEEAIYLGQRIVLMAPRPGRIDTVYEVPLPAERSQDMKLAPEFLALKREILERIRETSGMKTDFELLRKLSQGTVDTHLDTV